MHDKHYWPKHYLHDPNCEECKKTVYIRPLIWRVGCHIQHTWNLRAAHYNIRPVVFDYECCFCGEKRSEVGVELKNFKHPFCELDLHEWHYCDMGCCEPWCARCNEKYNGSIGIIV
jgi:hypothetical protein